MAEHPRSREELMGELHRLMSLIFDDPPEKRGEKT